MVFDMREKGLPAPALLETECTKWAFSPSSSTEPVVSKGSNDISSCNSCARDEAREFPALCDGPFINNLVSVSSKRRPECTCFNLCDERVLVLVARRSNWNPFLLCFLSCVCKKIRAICNRILWREFCLSRAPKMVSDLLLFTKERRIEGGWHAVGKLFLYCAGCQRSKSDYYLPLHHVAGHFVLRTRFSRTSGNSFLMMPCRKDVLYVSDPCEHANEPEDVGLFRGVFRGFDKSETKRLLTTRGIPVEAEEKCPYCKAKFWSMTRAKMIPRSASTRLAAYNDNVEFLVCHNGHLYGRCALIHLSDTDGSQEDG